MGRLETVAGRRVGRADEVAERARRSLPHAGERPAEPNSTHVTESAQRRQGRQPPAPDIELTASVKAEELEFREKPETEVSFSGSPDHESVSEDDRRNLPDTVRPGVKYRHVEVDYRLATRIAPPVEEEARRARKRRAS